jgi:hypothetical protein
MYVKMLYFFAKHGQTMQQDPQCVVRKDKEKQGWRMSYKPLYFVFLFISPSAFISLFLSSARLSSFHSPSFVSSLYDESPLYGTGWNARIPVIHQHKLHLP